MKLLLIFAILTCTNLYAQTVKWEADCASCQEQYGIFKDLSLIEKWTGLDHAITQLDTQTKDWDELQRYFDCYRQGDYVFNVGWRRFYDEVAELYQLPKAFLACISFIESRFNPNAKSPKGARGVAQLMPDNIDYLENLISPPTAIADCKRLCPAKDDLIKNRINCDQAKGDCDRASCYFCRSQYNKEVYSQKWVAASADLSSKRIIQGTLDSTIDPTNVVESVPAMAMFYHNIFREIDYYFKTNERLNEVADAMNGFKDPLKVYMLIAAISYNRGLPGTLRNLEDELKKRGSSTVMNWLSAAADNQESRDYMLRLQYCMNKGNFTPPSEGEKGKSCQ